MQREIGTFEFRDNGIMMRDLSSAETGEVGGGTGETFITSFQASANGSSMVTNGSFFLATSGTTAQGQISTTSTQIIGNGNTVGAFAFAQVV